MNGAYDPIPPAMDIDRFDDTEDNAEATTLAAAVQTDAPGTQNDTSSKTLETYYLPLYCITAFFAAMFIVVPFFICKGPDRWSVYKAIYKACVMLAAFCMWILWVTIYISQMNPIAGPRVSNQTLAWIAYRWGDSMTPPAEDVSTSNATNTNINTDTNPDTNPETNSTLK